MSNFIEQCIQTETTNLTNIIDESVKMTAKTQESLNAFNKEINEFICENDHILEKYSKNELKIDVPTGATPQRRVFVVPSELFRTQPHATLLDKYRDELKNLKDKTKLGVASANGSRSSSLDSASSQSSLKRSPAKKAEPVEGNKENTRENQDGKAKLGLNKNVSKKTLTVRNN
jgi:hypothetical protein